MGPSELVPDWLFSGAMRDQECRDSFNLTSHEICRREQDAIAATLRKLGKRDAAMDAVKVWFSQHAQRGEQALVLASIDYDAELITQYMVGCVGVIQNQRRRRVVSKY
jgi:hypothetical protein